MERIGYFKRALPLIAAGSLWMAYSTADAAQPSPLPAPRDFSFDDIAGRWHVQAHIPYSLERNRVAPLLRFERRDDGRYNEYFTSRKGGFDRPEKTFRQVTWAPDPERPWQLKTRVFLVLPARYSFFWFDRDKGIALAGTENRDKAWVFTRGATLDNDDWQAARREFARQGFDATRILRIPQAPEDLAKPGYALIER